MDIFQKPRFSVAKNRDAASDDVPLEHTNKFICDTMRD